QIRTSNAQHTGVKTEYDDLNSKHTPKIAQLRGLASLHTPTHNPSSAVTIRTHPHELTPVKLQVFYSLIHSNHAKICAFKLSCYVGVFHERYCRTACTCRTASDLRLGCCRTLSIQRSSRSCRSSTTSFRLGKNNQPLWNTHCSG